MGHTGEFIAELFFIGIAATMLLAFMGELWWFISLLMPAAIGLVIVKRIRMMIDDAEHLDTPTEEELPSNEAPYLIPRCC